MKWRRLHPGELDHELLWLIVSVGTALVALLWLRFGMPMPPCVWHELTGVPCIGCGSTRCVRLLVQGAWGAAFAMNPLTFTALAGVVIYDLYAAAVLLLRLPRLRPGKWPAWLGWTTRIAIAIALVANWAWLIARGV
ncbi:MAG: DUF2752 domain-containing protein [Chthoniobacteraceae bacterium]